MAHPVLTASGDEVRIARRVTRPSPVFAERHEAGAELARFIAPKPDPEALVLALPRGGVPVARPLADSLGCDLRPVLVRKLPVPDSPEAGFGAVTIDGHVVLNEPAVAMWGISTAEVHAVVDEVRRELERRAGAYPGGWPLPDMRGRHVFLVDDGLATGYSMIAAAKMARDASPSSITLAVPVAPADTLRSIARHFDDAYCLMLQAAPPFAVASFYRDFHDLDDAEVVALLEERSRA